MVQKSFPLLTFCIWSHVLSSLSWQTGPKWGTEFSWRQQQGMGILLESERDEARPPGEYYWTTIFTLVSLSCYCLSESSIRRWCCHCFKRSHFPLQSIVRLLLETHNMVLLFQLQPLLPPLLSLINSGRRDGYGGGGVFIGCSPKKALSPGSQALCRTSSYVYTHHCPIHRYSILFNEST